MKPRKTHKTKAVAPSAMRSASANPLWTTKDMQKAKPFDQLPRTMQQGLKAIKRRGRPPVAAPKKQITFRLEAALVDHLRNCVGYNSQIEQLLLKAWEDRRL